MVKLLIKFKDKPIVEYLQSEKNSETNNSKDITIRIMYSNESNEEIFGQKINFADKENLEILVNKVSTSNTCNQNIETKVDDKEEMTIEVKNDKGVTIYCAREGGPKSDKKKENEEAQSNRINDNNIIIDNFNLLNEVSFYNSPDETINFDSISNICTNHSRYNFGSPPRKFSFYLDLVVEGKRQHKTYQEFSRSLEIKISNYKEGKKKEIFISIKL